MSGASSASSTEGLADYRVDMEIVNGLTAAMILAEAIYRSTGAIVAIEEVSEDVQ